jgi:general secretion pathway protein K
MNLRIALRNRFRIEVTCASGLCAPSPERPPDIETATSEDGYALLLVIWAIGIISLLALSFLGSVRYRVMTATNIVESARAEALSEAGVNLAKLDLVLGHVRGNTGAQRFRPGGPMVFCAMPGQGVAGIVVEDEGGKLDLNAAPPKLLAHMLNGFGATPDQAENLAAAIADFGSTATNTVLEDIGRRAYANAGRSYGPKKALFETTLELDQVIGMPHQLFRQVLPYVTVHSHRPGIDPEAASPLLLAALAGEESDKIRALMQGNTARIDLASLPGRLPLGTVAPASGRSFLIHVEITMPGKSVFVREAIVELVEGDRPLALREWRRGERRAAVSTGAIHRAPAGRVVTLPAC